MSVTKEAYRDYLRSDEWAELRSEVRHERGNRCEFCGRPAGMVILHCHHMTYDRFGHEDKADLLILCEKDHSNYHKQFPAAIMPRMPVIQLKPHVFEVLKKIKATSAAPNRKSKKKSRIAKAKRRAAERSEIKNESNQGLAEYMKKTGRTLGGRISDRSAEIAAFKERQAEAERIRVASAALERLQKAEQKKRRQQAHAAASSKKLKKSKPIAAKDQPEQLKKPTWLKKKEKRERKALKRKRKEEWESAKDKALANVKYI